MPESLLPRRITAYDRSYPDGEYGRLHACIDRHYPAQTEGSSMALLFDVTFVNDPDTRLRMRYMRRDQCFRTESIAHGQPADELWSAMTDITEFYFEQNRKDQFIKLMADEHAMVCQGITHDEPTLRLQPLLGRFLSIMHGSRHPMSVGPGCDLKLFWSGPGTTGIILEDEIATMTEVPRT